MSHWYAPDGSTKYTVPYANGVGERDTNLTDARKLGLSPSVTTILGIVDKPALTIYKMNQLFEAMLDYPPPRTKGSIDEAEQLALYKKMVMGKAAAKGREAADRGTEIHDALDQYYSTGMIRNVPEDVRTLCTPVIELIADTFGHMANWMPEMSFTHSGRFGGKCDLHMKPCGEYPNGVILDFKTKATENFKGVKAYPEHCQQLVAYREGFNLPKAECYNLFISTHEPGALMLHHWEEKSCEKAWLCFQYLLQYWKVSNNLGN